jgi:hypothetical protein
MSKQVHAVLIHPEAPKVLVVMLDKYLRVYGDMRMIFASSANLNHYGFLEMEAVAKDKSKGWKISIPLQYVVAVAEAKNAAANEALLGFRPQHLGKK